MSMASFCLLEASCFFGRTPARQTPHVRCKVVSRPHCHASDQPYASFSGRHHSTEQGPAAGWSTRNCLPALASAALLLTPFQAPAAPNATLEAVSAVGNGLAEQNAGITRTVRAREAYLDINVDGQSKGRIVISLFEDVPVGSQRFLDIARGQDGISYQLSKVAEIGPSYIRVGDLQSLSYAADADAKIAGGDTVEQLEVELQDSRHSHADAGLVSLVVKDNKERPVKERLVAYQGKLVTVREQMGGAVPNGSGFVITTAAAPPLDSTNLVVGRVVQGMDVVHQIADLPVVKSNSGSPFLKVAKLAGDQRATVAEKSFNKPFKRVVIAQCGAFS